MKLVHIRFAIMVLSNTDSNHELEYLFFPKGESNIIMNQKIHYQFEYDIFK